MSSEARPSNFEIIYENYVFTFISKFTSAQDYQLVFLTSTKLIDSIKSTDPTDIKELIFARSKSECGFWRLCTALPENVGNNFYLEKGPQYTMSTFIIIELQLYLDSILDSLLNLALIISIAVYTGTNTWLALRLSANRIGQAAIPATVGLTALALGTSGVFGVSGVLLLGIAALTSKLLPKKHSSLLD